MKLKSILWVSEEGPVLIGLPQIQTKPKMLVLVPGLEVLGMHMKSSVYRIVSRLKSFARWSQEVFTSLLILVIVGLQQ